MSGTLSRQCILDFHQWYKRGNNRKPLLIRGARQTGKTTAVRLFAKEAGLDLIELNMEKTWTFASLFAANNPKKVIEAIEFELNVSISAEKSLLFFDEIQAEPSILALLRYFHEEMSGLPVLATGSLLEFTLADPEFSLPVGRIELYYMGPFTFKEFLSALGYQKAIDFIARYSMEETIPEAFHQQLNKLVKLYTLIGGMPEVISAYKENESLREAERIKSSIIETFILDFNKYKGKTNTDLLRNVFESIPAHIGKKIIFSRLNSNFRSKEVSFAIEQLCRARVLSKIFNTSANGIPLAAEKNERYYKPLFLDVGLLLTQLHLNPTEAESADDLNLVYQGCLSEQFIGQQLYYLSESYRNPELYYWARERKTASAEVDYVITDTKGKIIPVEVKSGKTGSLRSLQTLVGEKGLTQAIRFNSAPPSVFNEKRMTQKGEVNYTLISLPHYLVQQVKRLIESGV